MTRLKEAAFICVLLAGCGGDTPIEPVTPCTSDVAVTATANPLPVVTWSPECGATRVTIVAPPSQGFFTFWNIASPDGQIRPGVRYGQVPSGATEATPAQPLPSGTTVLVGVFGSGNRLIGQTTVRIP